MAGPPTHHPDWLSSLAAAVADAAGDEKDEQDDQDDPCPSRHSTHLPSPVDDSPRIPGCGTAHTSFGRIGVGVQIVSTYDKEIESMYLGAGTVAVILIVILLILLL